MDESPGVLQGRLDSLAVRLVYAQRGGGGPIGHLTLRLLGIDIPSSVPIGEGLKLAHVGTSHVVHGGTIIGQHVVINAGVVVGVLDMWSPSSLDAHVVIGDHVILGANAVVLVHSGSSLDIGEGTVVGANAVLTHSTGPWETWAGNPARRIGQRSRVVQPA